MLAEAGVGSVWACDCEASDGARECVRYESGAVELGTLDGTYADSSLYWVLGIMGASLGRFGEPGTDD